MTPKEVSKYYIAVKSKNGLKLTLREDAPESIRLEASKVAAVLKHRSTPKGILRCYKECIHKGNYVRWDEWGIRDLVWLARIEALEPTWEGLGVRVGERLRVLCQAALERSPVALEVLHGWMDRHAVLRLRGLLRALSEAPPEVEAWVAAIAKEDEDFIDDTPYELTVDMGSDISMDKLLRFRSSINDCIGSKSLYYDLVVPVLTPEFSRLVWIAVSALAHKG